MKPLALLAALCLVSHGFAASPAPASSPARLVLEPGDHICLIGNQFAERMQHDNHWETLLLQRFPKHNLVVRNLAFPADEVDIKTELTIENSSYSKGDKVLPARLRSQNFGSPDQHLAFSKATVVLACFGFNESFAGPAGVAKFKGDLAYFIDHTRKQNYSGGGAPRIVLVSPIAHENLGNPNLPDGKANNVNLKLYTEAMATVAAEKDVPFVDLFTVTLKTYATSPFKLTHNGVHLNPDGHKVVARLLDEGLFGKAGAPKEFNAKLHAELKEKNYQWFMRYRAVNGYYTYGKRSLVKFSDGEQRNADVMERERAVLDVMVANREARAWKVAQGETVSATIDDSNVPPFLEVKTHFGAARVNREKAANPILKGGMSSKSGEADAITYLPSSEALKKFKLAPGYAVNCFASEEQFPEIANAVQMSFDARGRLWVCTMPSYPQYTPLKDRLNGQSHPDDKLVILEDTDGDGKADKCTIFARGLHVPTGFEFYNGGVIIAQQPDLLFLKDTNGDDIADYSEHLLGGFDSGDSHHAINAFMTGPGGDLYFMEGTFFYTQVETPYGPVKNHNAGVYRYEPRTGKFETFISYGFANPWGIAFDRWGQVFIADASPGQNFFGTAFSGRTIFPDKHTMPMPQWIQMRVRPTSGCEFVSSRHFPDEAQGRYLLNNVIGVQGVLQHKVEEKDSGYVGTEIEPLLLSEDTNFRPVDMEFGPDGALYIVDWHEPLIGHLQYSIRDPLRDQTHGRIYRITYPGRPLLKPARIAGASIEALLELLKEPEDRVRYRVKNELGARPVDQVIAALVKWTKALNPADPNYEHHRLEALWLHQTMNVANEPLLNEILGSSEPRARAAAVRVHCYWRDRVNKPLDTLAKLVKDPHPRVRLEAVRSLSFFNSSKAAEIALESVELPQDQYLKYTLDETLRTLERFK
ncbi:MAG: azurin [Verrucomicrobia bacterium]|nr:azurin [Verrucomicrobiota bacterium]